MPPKQRRGSGWEKRPKRARPLPRLELAPPPPLPLAIAGPAAEEEPEALSEWKKLLDFVPALFSANYEPFITAEIEATKAAAVPDEPTSYRRQLKGAKADAYDERQTARVAESLAVYKRTQNQRAWSFSIVAKSLSWFNQRVPVRVWPGAQKARAVCSRDACKRIYEAMMQNEPTPAWTASPHVFVLGYDQTYCWQDCSKIAKRRNKAGAADPRAPHQRAPPPRPSCPWLWAATEGSGSCLKNRSG